MAVSVQAYARWGDRTITSYTLANAHGLRATLIDYGATLTEFWAPDRAGNLADIVLGYGDFDGYLRSETYFGATAGRYGNRIKDGRFVLDGVTHQLGRSEGRNHLHGGFKGFDKVVWAPRVDERKNAVTFRYRSPDGDEGYPGNLDFAVEFRLTEDDRFLVDMSATTDKPTIVNVVHHSYWNLAGHASGTVLGQDLVIHADHYTPCDEQLMTTGEIAPVRGTPFDFTIPKPIGRDIDAIDNAGGGRSVDSGGGYDHNWVLRGKAGDLKPCMRAVDPLSGRAFELGTSEPGVQFYTGGYLSPAVIGKGGVPYCRYAGFTLETQKFPDTPNFPQFPSARLDPGQTYRHLMDFRFFTVAPVAPPSGTKAERDMP